MTTEEESEDVTLPISWLDGFTAAGIPRWAALEAWNHAADDETVAQIRARAKVIFDLWSLDQTKEPPNG